MNNGDGTVTDNATGLMWAQADSTTASAAIAPVFAATQITNMVGQEDYPWYWSGTTHLKYTGSAASGSYVCFGRGTGTMNGTDIIDVHGAGCQRSDPKTGEPADYPRSGHGPQGDVQRIFNHVRLVRDIEVAETPDPESDTDGDGFTYAEEIFTGTDPDNPDSFFTLSLEGSTLSWPHAAGVRYKLEGCTNLLEGSWFPIASTTSSNYTGSAEYNPLLYRIEATEAP